MVTICRDLKRYALLKSSFLRWLLILLRVPGGRPPLPPREGGSPRGESPYQLFGRIFPSTS